MTLPYIPAFGVGSTSAPLVLMEVEDLQCPYCNSFSRHTMQSFQKEFVDTGKIRFLDPQFPLEMHPSANQLSIAAICAGRSGKFGKCAKHLRNRIFPLRRSYSPVVLADSCPAICCAISSFPPF